MASDRGAGSTKRWTCDSYSRRDDVSQEGAGNTGPMDDEDLRRGEPTSQESPRKGRPMSDSYSGLREPVNQGAAGTPHSGEGRDEPVVVQVASGIDLDSLLPSRRVVRVDERDSRIHARGKSKDCATGDSQLLAHYRLGRAPGGSAVCRKGGRNDSSKRRAAAVETPSWLDGASVAQRCFMSQRQGDG